MIGRVTLTVALALGLSIGHAEARKKRPRAAASSSAASGTAAGDNGQTDSATPPRGSVVPGQPSAAREVVQRESRIEFDERLVQGQSAAGAIYLFQRSGSQFNSLVKIPESFRERTVQQVFPTQSAPGAPPASPSTPKAP